MEECSECHEQAKQVYPPAECLKVALVVLYAWFSSDLEHLEAVGGRSAQQIRGSLGEPVSVDPAQLEFLDHHRRCHQNRRGSCHLMKYRLRPLPRSDCCHR